MDRLTFTADCMSISSAIAVKEINALNMQMIFFFLLKYQAVHFTVVLQAP